LELIKFYNIGQYNKAYKSNFVKDIMPKKKTSKKKKNSEKKEICEVYEIEKDGKQTEKEVCGKVEKKHASKEEIKNQNKILRNLLIGLGIFVLIIIVGMFVYKSAAKFEHQGVSWEIVQEGKLIFYNTKFPFYDSHGNHQADYNFYIRNDPRTLDKEVPFLGELDLKYYAVINSTDNFDCDGDGIIAIANLVKLYEFLEIKVMKDENASCDSEGRYMYMNIQSGNETKIEQIGNSCYILYVNNCEILESTERFMVETFIEVEDMKQGK
jgi:hypothetical protein